MTQSAGLIDTVIVGGCGHVGLPLGIALADSGRSVVVYDIDVSAVATVNSGTLPFMEEVLEKSLRTWWVMADSLRAQTQIN